MRLLVLPVPLTHLGCFWLAGTSWRPAGASLAWLQASLASLNTDLRQKFGPGAGLILRRGPYQEALQEVAARCDASCLHYSRRLVRSCHFDWLQKGIRSCMSLAGSSGSHVSILQVNDSMSMCQGPCLAFWQDASCLR